MIFFSDYFQNFSISVWSLITLSTTFPFISLARCLPFPPGLFLIFVYSLSILIALLLFPLPLLLLFLIPHSASFSSLLSSSHFSPSFIYPFILPSYSSLPPPFSLIPPSLPPLSLYTFLLIFLSLSLLLLLLNPITVLQRH